VSLFPAYIHREQAVKVPQSNILPTMQSRACFHSATHRLEVAESAALRGCAVVGVLRPQRLLSARRVPRVARVGRLGFAHHPPVRGRQPRAVAARA
jgi:hypothetical protein